MTHKKKVAIVLVTRVGGMEENGVGEVGWYRCRYICCLAEKAKEPPSCRASLFDKAWICHVTENTTIFSRGGFSPASLPCHPALTAGLALAVDRRHPQVGGASVEKDQEVLGWSSDADLTKVGSLMRERGYHRVDWLARRDPGAPQLHGYAGKDPGTVVLRLTSM